MDQLISQAERKSRELLRQNTAPFGYRAARNNSEKPEYSYLFGRDGSICALCTIGEDDELQQHAQKSLETLRDNRSELGQVPCRVNPSQNYQDFWFPENLDSTLWWVLAALKLAQAKPALKARWQKDIELSLTWLRYQDKAEVGLLTQGQRADWADELPNHGVVLYSNAIWYKVVSEYISTYGQSYLINDPYRQKIHAAFNAAFWPYDGNHQHIANKALSRSIDWVGTDLVYQPYYISYLSRRAYGGRCDLFGNILAMLFGLANDERLQTIEHFLWSINVSTPFPGRSLYPVIYPGEEEWQDGMASRNQNVPHQYHNGGIWPLIGGFWVTYLATRQTSRETAKSPSAEAELLKLAQANALNDWEFNEYLHGQFGTPMGIAHQSWNAASYLLAYNATILNKNLFDSHSKSTGKERKSLNLADKLGHRFTSR